MELGRTYPIEEMGTLTNPHAIFLHSSFLREKLGVNRLDINPFFSDGEKELTKVVCPFCRSGRLKCIKIDPQYYNSRLDFFNQPSAYQVGNEYFFECSNPECDGRFSGIDIWTHIG